MMLPWQHQLWAPGVELHWAPWQSQVPSFGWLMSGRAEVIMTMPSSSDFLQHTPQCLGTFASSNCHVEHGPWLPYWLPVCKIRQESIDRLGAVTTDFLIPDQVVFFIPSHASAAALYTSALLIWTREGFVPFSGFYNLNYYTECRAYFLCLEMECKQNSPRVCVCHFPTSCILFHLRNTA